jgi:transposase, IS30 family
VVIDAGRVAFIDTPVSPRFLSQDNRIEIADGLARGEPVKATAVRIGKSYQTVYREIARNSKPDGRYQPWHAHGQAHLRRKRPRTRVFEADAELARIVAGRLERRWSPGQISRWLRRRYPRKPNWHVCTQTIYEAVYRGLIVPVSPPLLRTSRTYRHRRGRGRSRDGALRQCTTIKPIRLRPAAAESRRQAGHWEGDLLIGAGQRSAIATLVERKTRYTVLVPLPDGHCATSVADALTGTFKLLPPRLRRTLTWDQGNEMFQHPPHREGHRSADLLRRPHSPWQRGTNENTGLLRQYLPKGSDLNSYPRHELDTIAAELNDRPRLYLADRTPAQLMRRWHLPETAKIRDDP